MSLSSNDIQKKIHSEIIRLFSQLNFQKRKLSNSKKKKNFQFYPYCYYVLGPEHIMTRFWYPYEHSVYGLLILWVTDFLQDLFLVDYIYKATGCSYSYFLGRPVFSYVNKTLIINAFVLGWAVLEFSRLAYIFDHFELGEFKPKDSEAG